MIPLRNWLWEKHRNDKTFTETKFAEKLGIARNYFSNLKNQRLPISMRLALLIEQETGGAVNALELIKENLAMIPRNPKGRKKKNPTTENKNEN